MMLQITIGVLYVTVAAFALYKRGSAGRWSLRVPLLSAYSQSPWSNSLLLSSSSPVLCLRPLPPRLRLLQNSNVLSVPIYKKVSGRTASVKALVARHLRFNVDAPASVGEAPQPTRIIPMLLPPRSGLRRSPCKPYPWSASGFWTCYFQ
ncbi:hypothetical protein K438DRAFT_60933 [Mycena galopus ATCC 62051]|nr:hypothetical protein K438DRAFT_60933 [Mycena galopus ATCC 62051]